MPNRGFMPNARCRFRTRTRSKNKGSAQW